MTDSCGEREAPEQVSALPPVSVQAARTEHRRSSSLSTPKTHFSQLWKAKPTMEADLVSGEGSLWFTVCSQGGRGEGTLITCIRFHAHG